MSIKGNGLQALLTLSEKRKEILFLLQEKARTLTEIKDYFDVKTPEIMPRLKEMEAANIIIKKGEQYHITPLGNVIAMHYRPFLDTLAAIEANEDFWNEHDISAIPGGMLYRIQELKECKTVKMEDYNINESHPEFIENVGGATRVMGAACIFRSTWIDLILDCANQGVPIDIIITKGIYEKIIKEYHDELETLLKTENAHIRVCDELNISFTITDSFFSLSLNYPNGHHDTRDDLIGSDNASIKWGEDLFKHYLKDSIEVECIGPINKAIEQELYSQSLLI